MADRSFSLLLSFSAGNPRNTVRPFSLASPSFLIAHIRLTSSLLSLTTAGIPSYRTKVLYVPQRPSLLPGSPTDFLAHIQTFGSRSSHSSSSSSSSWLPSFLSRKQDIALDDGDENDSKDDGLDPYELANKWDVPRELWNRGWGDLSGGESQRIALACALGRGNGLGGGGEIVLLDGEFSSLLLVVRTHPVLSSPSLFPPKSRRFELTTFLSFRLRCLPLNSTEPTSALDPETSAQVEASLLSLLPPSTHNPSGKGSKTPGSGGPKAYLLITHSAEQAERLAGKGAKVVNLSNGQDTPPDEEEEDERNGNGNGRNGGKKAKNSSSSQV